MPQPFTRLRNDGGGGTDCRAPFGGLACRLGRCFCFAEVSTGHPHRNDGRGKTPRHISVITLKRRYAVCNFGKHLAAAFGLLGGVFRKNYHGVFRLFGRKKAAKPALADLCSVLKFSRLRGCGFSRGAYGFRPCGRTRSLLDNCGKLFP